MNINARISVFEDMLSQHKTRLRAARAIRDAMDNYNSTYGESFDTLAATAEVMLCKGLVDDTAAALRRLRKAAKLESQMAELLAGEEVGA